MRSILKHLSAPWIMGSLFIILAAAMAMATFIENSYGTDAARALVYNTTWFEVVFALLAINMLASIFQHKMWQWSKASVLLFHFSFFIIIVGAAVTRYVGDEGLLAVREGAIEQQMLSLEPEITAVWNAKGEIDSINRTAFLSVVTPYEFDETLKAGDSKVSIKSAGFIPNALLKAVSVHNGEPLVSLTLSGRTSRQEVNLHLGEKSSFENWVIGFEPMDTTGVDIILLRNKNQTELQLLSSSPYAEINMGDRHIEPAYHDHMHSLHKGKIYDFGTLRLALTNFILSGQMVPITTTQGKDDGSPHGVIFDLNVAGLKKQTTVFGRSGQVGKATTIHFPEGTLELRYGARRINLPFSIQLNKFILTRYPGSESPSSYLSEVTLIDAEKGLKEPHSIFMNNILNYRGYRLYQSSYDRDEKGTVLSVNHDGLGTLITYIGYFLMALGMLLALIQSKTRFGRLMAKVNRIHQKRKMLTVLMVILFTGSIWAERETPPIPDKQAAEILGSLWVQDNSGRTKPLNSLHQEVVVKLVKHNSFMGHTVDQMILGILMYPLEWQSVPLITVKHETLRDILQLTHKKASFSQFFNNQRQYIIHQMVDEAHRTNPSHRSKLEQELIKVDEQVNIFYLILSGKFHRIYPQIADSHLPWLSPTEEITNLAPSDSFFVKNSLPLFIQELKEGDKVAALNSLHQISEYQYIHGEDILPSAMHGKVERLYNQLNIFLWLSTLFFGLGLLLVVHQFVLLLKPSLPTKWVNQIGTTLILAGFIYYTFGLGLRWYVAGHAPWSNGYESMVFIGWAILLAGIFWIRKSTWVLPITATFAGLALMIAHLSWMNPQITSLVPVLQSYWLTIHVSVITAGYGFLALGALLGFLNLITMVLRNKHNFERLQLTIEELTSINEMSLTVGLYLMTIGSFLGGVWANESWGRYWGWDAKETWSLITIVLYALVLHLRFIPGLKGKLVFNIASLITISSVIMTYLGVNYYLSGMHSYGAGEAMPIPAFVYYAVAIVVVLALLAWNNDRKWE
ncbi:MAG TPA: cytochrome c biogenesis protein CcsA, partial [Marinilabiliaceae bacterium]|nr:cytochrome c biogenesis protein CcsA [Marinilabiliaceae bacterium]